MLLWREWADQHKVLFLDGDDEGFFFFFFQPHSARCSFKNPQLQRSQKLSWKTIVLGSGQLFTLVSHDLCVPGICPEA